MEVILNSQKRKLWAKALLRGTFIYSIRYISRRETGQKRNKTKGNTCLLDKKTFVLFKFSHRILFMFLMSVKNFALCFLAFCSLWKQPFPLALRRWERFARKVPNDEGRGETAFFAGYRFSGLEFRLKEVVCVCLRFSYTRRDIFILAEI